MAPGARSRTRNGRRLRRRRVGAEDRIDIRAWRLRIATRGDWPPGTGIARRGWGRRTRSRHRLPCGQARPDLFGKDARGLENDEELSVPRANGLDECRGHVAQHHGQLSEFDRIEMPETDDAVHCEGCA